MPQILPTKLSLDASARHGSLNGHLGKPQHLGRGSEWKPLGYRKLRDSMHQ